MKIFPFILLLSILFAAASAQSPQSFKYQAVARDNSGSLLANKNISFRISIIRGNVSGSVVYTELHSKTTNTFGLIDLEIGGGTSATGNFTAIDWGADRYFLKVEMDPAGGIVFQLMGTSQLLSVPYALYAKDVQNNSDADADPANELQDLSLTGNTLKLSKSLATVNLSPYMDNTDNQTLNLSGNNLSISGGNTVTFTTGGTGDNWGSQIVVTDATLTGNGLPATPLKVNQQAATIGQVLKWSGTSWIPAADETGSGGSNPTGPAGGDLTGSYPNPVIGDNKVNSAKILDLSIGANDLTNSAVTTTKIADNAVTIAKLPAGAASDKYLRGDGTWATPVSGIMTEADPTWAGDPNETVDIGRAGRVGIGITRPLGLLHVEGRGTGEGNVVFIGNGKLEIPGDPPVTGAGTRMMWYPDKVALRAGEVFGNNWDKTNIGYGSVAFGIDSKASGNYSSAFGYQCTASGSYSFALGYSSTASGLGSFAAGLNTTSSSNYSASWGSNTLASGLYSFASGYSTTAPSLCETVVGIYNTNYSGNSSSLIPTNRIFVVGNGTGSSDRSNALTILKNGNVGVGTDQPSTVLHVQHNSTIDQPQLLLTESESDYSRLMFKNTAATSKNWTVAGLTAATDAASRFNFYYFNGTSGADIISITGDGKVGIGNTSPAFTLEVSGTAGKPGGGSWSTSSDKRLKNLLGIYTKGLREIAALQPVKFTYKKDNPRHLPTTQEQIGFVAQDVQKIFPEAVSEGTDGFLDFNMHAVNVALVNAVKELKAENDRLKAENEKLGTRLEKIEKLMGISALK